eukprot:TRINITY_DN34393_c0_g1_i1.p1 TRINITY_DN34393_c0_g1~~TRINITY_DN34393_c0_g1_i1.p1  ORF type:complete len:349 (+),score=55.34 TRINITY_DN34393_c0_g1_i1:103-1149(+)
MCFRQTSPGDVPAQHDLCVGTTVGSTVRIVHTHASSASGQSQCSFLFDVTAKTNITVGAVSFVPGTPEGDFEIWSAPEMHERVHQSQKAWTMVTKGSHSGPRGVKHRAPLQCHVTIPQGERHAFYISGHNSNAVCFCTDTNVSNSGENEDMILHLGHFKSYPWESQLSTGPFGHNGMQEFVGSLEYQVVQTHAVDHAETTAKELWLRRPFPDAYVVAADGKKFPVHRSILAAASPVFEAAWRQPLRESEERVLRIDASAEAVEALLCFMYTGQEITTTDPGEILGLAHIYGLLALVRASAARLASQVRALRPYRADASVSGPWRTLLENIQGILAADVALLEEVLLTV